MKKKELAAVIALTMFACLLFCAPAFACYNWNGYPMQGEEHPLYHNGTVANGTVIGGVYVDAGHGLSGEMPYTQTFSVPAYDEVRFAHLYVHVWGATSAYHGWLNTSFNGHSLGNLTLLGEDDVGSGCEEQVWCASCGTYVMWYNVTNIVVQGDNSAAAVTGRLTGNFDGRVGMIELIVVYEKAGMAETRYWIVQGHEALTYPYLDHPAKDYGYSYFNGTINPDDWVNAVFYNTWLTGDMNDNDTLWFNDNMLCEGCTNYDQGAYFDFKAFEVKNASVDYLSSGNNYATYWRAEDHYVHWLNTVLVLSREPDLMVEHIDLNTGWNLISVPLNLISWELGEEAVVGNPLNVTPKNSLTSIYRYNTSTALFEKCDHFDDWGWSPATGSESFTELEPGRGYWVKATSDCSLTFTGTEAYDIDVSLATDWNLIGWYSAVGATLGEEAVVGNPLDVTPENSLTSIYRYNSSTELFEKCDHFADWGWSPATGSEGFTELEPCSGYWVMAENACEWKHVV